MTEKAEYYQWGWLGDDDYERGMFTDEYDLAGLDPWLPTDQKTVDAWPAGVTFSAEGTFAEDFPYPSTNWLLFSARARQLSIRARLTGIDFYPVELTSAMKCVLPDYWYAHLALVSGAIDMSRSTYRYAVLQQVDDPVLIMIKYVLYREAIEPYDFFRVTESPCGIFCSDRFRRVVEENGLTGVGFLPARLS